MKRGMSVVTVFCTIIAMMVAASNVSAKDTIKLGVVEPLSGNFKDIGERYLEGATYAVKTINENGGLLGQKVEIVAVDSELKPDVATRKTKKLILQKGMQFFCSGTGSSVGGAMSALIEKHNGIYYTYGQDASSMTGSKCNKNFFRPGGSTDGRSAALAQWAVKKGYTRIAAIVQDYSFGQEALAAFKKKMLELNPKAEFVAELYHPIGTKDFAPYISQIISAKPEVVFTSNWGNDLMLLLKQGKPMGVKTPFICYFANDDVMIKGVANDEAVIGSLGVDIYMISVPTEENKSFIKKFHKDKGHYPVSMVGKAYTATMFWAEAIKKASSTKTEEVINAWEGLEYNGPAGKWVMRACDHQAQVPYWAGKIVKDNPFFDHAFMKDATMIPAKDVEVPCEETGCKM